MCHNIPMNDQITVSAVFIAVNAGIIALTAMIYSKGEMHFGAVWNCFLVANRLICDQCLSNIV